VPELKETSSRGRPGSTYYAVAQTGEELIIVEHASDKPGPELHFGGSSFPVPGLFPPYSSLAFSRDQKLLAVASSRSVSGPERGRSETWRLHVVSIPERSELFSAPLDNRLVSVGFAADGASVHAVTAPPPSKDGRSAGGKVWRWKVSGGEPIGEPLPVENPIAVTLDQGQCLERANAQDIYIRDLSTGERSARPVAIEPGLRGVAFFPDGTHFATFGGQSWLRVWSLEPSEGPLPHD
jgi:hypothetical protein